MVLAKLLYCVECGGIFLPDPPGLREPPDDRTVFIASSSAVYPGLCKQHRPKVRK